VPITLSDVKSPAGDIKGDVWFPGVDPTTVDADLTGFIADAYTKTDDDEAAEQWVYYRAATAVADRLGGQGGGSTTINLVDQLSKTTTYATGAFAYWVQKAAAYLAAFEAADADVVDDPLGGYRVLTSLRHAE
jgi:hypothetical protein